MLWFWSMALRIVTTGAGLWVAQKILPGVAIDGIGTIVLGAVVLGILNSVVRPLLVVLSVPFVVLTLGLFLFVLNAAMFGLAAWLLPNFQVSGFFPALGGSLIVSCVSWALSFLPKRAARKKAES